jgi:hypothetical protein
LQGRLLTAWASRSTFSLRGSALQLNMCSQQFGNGATARKLTAPFQMFNFYVNFPQSFVGQLAGAASEPNHECLKYSGKYVPNLVRLATTRVNRSLEAYRKSGQLPRPADHCALDAVALECTHAGERTERRHLHLAMEAIFVGTRRRDADQVFRKHAEVGIQPLGARNTLSRPGQMVGSSV